MTELKIEDIKLPEKIAFNYEELKAELTEKIKIYTNLVYTEDQIKDAKADRANLNRLKKALNDERIKREKEYMVPFNDFKTKINEIIGIIDKPVAIIDAQVKKFEEAQKQKKADEIKALYEAQETPEWLTIEKIYNPKWLNASTSMKSIQEEMSATINSIKTNMETIQALPEFNFEALEEYKRTLDINKAIAEGKRLADIQKRKQEAEERAKAEAEARAQAQAEVQAQAEAQAEPQAEEPAEEPKEEQKHETEAVQWVRFQALLTIEQAKELKAFFEARKIDFKAI